MEKIMLLRASFKPMTVFNLNRILMRKVREFCRISSVWSPPGAPIWLALAPWCTERGFVTLPKETVPRAKGFAKRLCN